MRAAEPLRPVASVGFKEIKKSLCTSHPLSEASDVLKCDGLCQIGRYSHRNQKDTGDDARPAIIRECVRASQTDNANKER
jgi:hypothetical protein